MAHFINNLLCTSCHDCIKSCPRSAISEHDICFLVIDELLCTDCGNCMEICKKDAIMVLSKAS